jgi:ubiquinone/menaquinone biosynthesis C-methylase UbiE
MESCLRGHGAARVLDLGCGGGHVSYRAAPHVAKVVAYDLSADMLAAVRHAAAERGLGNIATQAGAAEDVPFPDRSFDFVLSRYSAHHWQDFARGLREARRVLKPGGRAVFADSISPGALLLDTFLQSVELLRDPSHVRSYSRKEWEEALRAAGFRPGAAIERWFSTSLRGSRACARRPMSRPSAPCRRGCPRRWSRISPSGLTEASPSTP